MVRLAPHLVRPLPLVVPAFDGARPDRLTGIGLNMYDVMAAPSLRGRRSARRDAADGLETDWSPARHRVISGEEVSELLPALAGREPEQRLPVLRLPDRRRAARADRAGGGRALRGDLRQPPRGHRSALREPTAASPCATGRAASASRIRAANVINATGVWADQIRPEELYSEAEVPRIAPSRGTHVTLRHEDLPLRRRSDRPGRRGAVDLRAAVAGPQPDRHHRQQLRGRPRPRPALGRRRRLPARGDQPLLRLVPDHRGSDRRLRRRAAADLHAATTASRSTSRARPSCMRPPAV